MAIATTPIRVLIGKVGLDGHDRGVKLVVRALRDAGVEIIYTGLHQTPEQIVTTAIQEDVQAIGLSIHLLKEQGAGDVTLFGGGIIPDDDVPRLKAAGVQMLFRPATPMHDIVDFVKGLRVER